MTDYYFDSVNGDDGNDGLSAANPKETLDYLQDTLLGTGPVLDAGDTVYFARGSEWIHSTESFGCMIPLKNATTTPSSLTAWFKFFDYGVGPRPIFNMNNVAGEGGIKTLSSWDPYNYVHIRGLEFKNISVSTPSMSVITQADSHYWIIDDCYIHTGSTSSDTVDGIHVKDDSTFTLIKNTRIHNIDGEGIYVSSVGTDRSGMVFIKDVDIRGCGGEALDVKDHGFCVLVDGLYSEENGQYSYAAAGTWHILLGGVGHHITNSWFHRRGQGVDADGAVRLGDYDSVITPVHQWVERSLFTDFNDDYAWPDANTGATRVDSDSETTLGMLGCTFADNDRAAYAEPGAVFKNCIFFNNATNFIFASGSADIDTNMFDDDTEGSNPITDDPEFASVNTKPLLSISPAINSGLDVGWLDFPNASPDLGWKQFGTYRRPMLLRQYWDDTTGWTTSGSPTINSASARTGDNGLNIAYTAGSKYYISPDFNTALYHCWFSFDINLDDIDTPTNADVIQPFIILNSSNNHLFIVNINRNSGAWRVRVKVRDDSGSFSSSSYVAWPGTGWQRLGGFFSIELQAGQDRGIGMLTIDGEWSSIVSGVNNDAVGDIRRIRVGNISPTIGSSGGSIAIDNVLMHPTRPIENESLIGKLLQGERE